MQAHKNFIQEADKALSPDPTVLGLAIGGSWLKGNIDEYSDLDLILVTKNKVSGKDLMLHVYLMTLYCMWI